MEHIQSALRRIRRWILVSGALFVLVGIGVMTLVPVDEKVRATGTVVAEDELYLYAPAVGVIQEIRACEGADVKTNEVILVLDTEDLQNQHDQLLAELKEADAQAQLKRSQMEHIAKLPLPKEFWYAQTQLAAAEQKARYTAEEHARYQQLFNSKLTSESELAARQLADQLAQADLANARANVHVINTGLEQSITTEALADLNSALAHVEKLKIDLAVCEREIARRRVRSPSDGKVTLLLKRRVGERVEKGEELVHVARGAARRARLFVGEPEIHRVHVGQEVRLSTPAFNSLRYGYIDGHIVERALEADPRPTDNPDQEARYLIKVQIDHTPIPLVLGASLNAEIILRRVPIWRLFLPAEIDKSGS